MGLRRSKLPSDLHNRTSFRHCGRYSRARSRSEGEEAASAKAELEARFIQSGVASCETLLSILTPKFEAEPNNAELAGRIVKMLNVAEDCIKNDLYLKAVTVMHADNPSYPRTFR